MTLYKDLLHGARFVRRNPGFTLAAVLTLGLGIGANTAIFSFVNALLLRPLPFAEPDRLIRIESIRGNEAGKLMPREWEELDREASIFSGVAGWYPSQYNLATGGRPEVVRACMTTANLFRVLGVKLIHGSSWQEGTHRMQNPATVLNHELWKNRLGADPAIVGTSITMDNSPYQVYGIAEAGFQFPVRSDVFRAANLGGAQNNDVRSLFVVARLKRGISIEQAQVYLDAFGSQQEQIYPESNRGIRFRATSLREAYTGEVRPHLLLRLSLAGIVLLIAACNVVNLQLSRALTRRKETAVRAALGASRIQIVRQLLSETMIITALGATAGLAFSWWWMRILREMLRVDLPSWMAIEIDGTVLLFTLAIACLSGLAAGVAPAFAASRVDLQDAMRESARGSSGGRLQAALRRTLVGGEIALAVILLIAAGLLVRSFSQLQQTDPGFQRAHILTFRTDPPWARYNNAEQTSLFYRLALEKLEALPGVEAAAANHSLPLALNQNYGKPSIAVEGQSVDEQQRNPFVNVQIVSPNYLRTMGVPLHRGRHFNGGDRLSTTPAVILSRPLADRLFGTVDPVGRRVRMHGLVGALDEKQENWFSVIGVAAGVKSESLLSAEGMDLYLSNQQQFAGDTFFVVRTLRDPLSLTSAVENAIRKVDPEQPIFDVQPLQELVEDTVWQRRLAGALSLWFGALALLLAAVGVYGILSYTVMQRTREMGIRQALGSTPGEVRRLVVADGVKLALAGIAAGGAVAIPLAWMVEGLLYGVSPFDPVTFAAAPALVLAVAVMACYVPAVRASRADPLAALRQE